MDANSKAFHVHHCLHIYFLLLGSNFPLVEILKVEPSPHQYQQSLWTLTLRSSILKMPIFSFLFFFFKAKISFLHHFHKRKLCLTSYLSKVVYFGTLLIFHPLPSTFVLHCKIDDKRPVHQHELAFIPSFSHSLSASQDYLGSE